MNFAQGLLPEYF